MLQQLPERLEKNLFISMTPEQWRHHEENRELVARLVAKWRRYRYLSEADQRRLMIALQNMRMACDSSYLLDPQSDHGVKADELRIEGLVSGEVSETRKVEVFPRGKLTGKISAQLLVVRDGGFFEGECAVGPNSPVLRDEPGTGTTKD